MKMRTTGAAALSFAIIGVIAGCGQSYDVDSGAETTETLDILIDWQAEPSYAGIYFAIDQGYFADIGYDAKVTESWGANQAVAAVASGNHVIGTASGGATVMGRNNGAEVVSVAVLYQTVPSVIYGFASSQIEKPSDLKGRRVGLYPGSVTVNEFDAFLIKNDISASEIEVVSLSGADLPYLLSDQVQGVLHYTEMAPVLAETSEDLPGQPGERTYELKLAEYGVSGYGLNVIANKKANEENPDLVAKFRDAIVRGYEEGCVQREAVVASFVQRFPDKRPDYVSQSWNKVCELVGSEAGNQTYEGWEATIALYRDLGLLTSDVSPDDIIG